jgi:multimeric flavodoxin WrbA
MRAVILNCTLKQSPEPSNTQELADVVVDGLKERGADVVSYRVADHHVPPGISTDLGDPADDWPRLHAELLGSEILIIATPTWLGRPSSIAQRVLERMDGMLSETDADGRPVAYNRVAGVVVTGNEDGAHHVISEVTGDTDHGHEWSHQTGKAMAHNLFGVASALRTTPLAAPPGG